MDFIIQFLKDDILPEERIETDKVRRNATRYWLSENQKLYKHSFSGPYLLYVHPKLTKSLLEELHEGICGSHTGGRSLAHRAITQGYWWPNMINANSLRRAYTNQGEFLIRYLAYGHLLNRAWTLWDHSPKQWEIRNISWSAQITLRNGLKRNL